MAVVPYANVSSAPSEEDFVVTGWLKYAPMTTRAATKAWSSRCDCDLGRPFAFGAARTSVRNRAWRCAEGENGIAQKYSQRVARRDVEEDMSIGYAMY